MWHGLEFALGLLIWLGSIWDGFATIVLPRTVAPMRRLSGRFNRWSWRLWSAVGRRIGPEGLRLSFLAVYGPISVMLLLIIWAGLIDPRVRDDLPRPGPAIPGGSRADRLRRAALHERVHVPDARDRRHHLHRPDGPVAS